MLTWLYVVSLILQYGNTLYVKYDLGAQSKDNIWKFVNKNGSVRGTATVPGGIYTDLKTAGILTEDFYYRFNDDSQRWVGHDDWTYNRTFKIPADFTGKKQINLVFYGLDTAANVTLNGQLLRGCDNMFRRYILPVTKYIKMSEDNDLVVQFQSPVTYSNQRSAKKPVPPGCVVEEFNGECHANQIRKMQASFSWDWGPAFPSVGIWKEVILEAFDKINIRETIYTFQHDDMKAQWTVTLKVYADLPDVLSSGSGDLKFNLKVENDETVTSQIPVTYTELSGTLVYTMELTIPDVKIKRWWPNGMGDQVLYNSTVEYHSEGSVVSAKHDKIGFRTLRLVQDEVFPGKPNLGLSFYFEVNSQPMFAKGSNWIPAHVLPELGSSPQYVDDLLGSSKEANFNMLRVWGGGVYETDYFYEKCDELGILVWQDFMFACSMYPVDEPFLDTVREEIKYNVRRLQHHPSIALWAGNNENEGGLLSFWFGIPDDEKKSMYLKLNVDVIRAIVLEEDPSRSFITSSPGNGLMTEKEGFIGKTFTPDSLIYGDTHHYDYYCDAFDTDAYPVSRFCSEFGFQSLPSFSSLLSISGPGDFDKGIKSELIMKRQHHPGGNLKLVSQVTRTLLPQGNHNFDTLDKFSNLPILTQIFHAVAVKTAAESHRRGRIYRDEVLGHGLTMGSLYWQLNDIWQAPSWASIEHGGKWKALHYHAMNAYSKVMVSPYRKKDKSDLQIFIANDGLESISGLLEINVFSWNQFETPMNRTTIKVEVAANGVQIVHEIKLLDNFMKTVGCQEFTRRTCFLTFRLLNEESQQQIAPSNFFLPMSIGFSLGFKKPNIIVSSVTEGSLDGHPSRYVHAIDVVLNTDAITLFIWLDEGSIKGRWTENSFIMTEKSKTITFLSLEETTPQKLQQNLKVSSLINFWPNL